MTFQLDDLDYRILEQLIRDGRKSFTDIADELKVAETSQATCRQKILSSILIF